MLTMKDLISLVVLLLTPIAAAAADGGVVLPPGRVVYSQGCLVTDSGRSIVGLVSPAVRGRMSMVVWRGGELQTHRLSIEGKRLELLDHDRILIWGYKLVDGVDPYADSYEHGDAIFTHQIYRITGTGLKLVQELEEGSDESGWTRIADDLETWVTMKNLRPDPPGARRVLGRHFAIGSVKSGKTRRTESLELYPASSREHDVTAFEILNPEGPILLASYAADLFLIRFHDYGVHSLPVDHLRHVVHPRGGDLDVVWQSEDRVLWARKGGEWLAYDLWNVRYELAVPEVPFLRRSAADGSPHPIRGFVQTERDGGRWRVKHSWRSPQFENWREEHVSEWRRGPLPVAVSPNGRHALVLESRTTEEGERVTHARRFGLDLAPMLPPVEAASAEAEGRRQVQQKPGG